MKRTTLPTIVIGRRMYGTSVEENPKITFELEAETGELFEVSFSLRGIVSTVTMALNWLPLKEGLADVEPPINL